MTYTTIADLPQACDLLYCNSVLQYFGSNAEFLDIVTAVKPRHILLDDLLAKGDTDFFSTQAYYGTDIPHRFLGMNQLVGNLKSVGYRLAFSAPFASPILGRIGPLPMENFPEAFRLRHSLTALFARS